ncbi:response regulator transcription factor [Sinorhizobium sp. NFACC03]|uniref:winged helix-turn-helix transcriptional regulator n=1 Tax=Sinorhizobium sp. NFACC03 TaxID=1566295 RepID=UPI00088F6D20|nr:response regulator transcription factor [Sinorhizobium sp. NFACC03]SDA87608.1 two-component system, OmpR family, phosphate regulon response regulator PhoB [Sinorhizobium sp. NFACC03]
MACGVLIQTDNVQLFLLLKHILATQGFEVQVCTGQAGLFDAFQKEAPVAVLLDCSCRPEALLGLCGRIKAADANVAIAAFIKSSDADYFARHPGVDAVICSPFDPELLLGFLMRLRTATADNSDATSGPVLRYSDVEMNISRVRVTRSGNPVTLSALQFRLLLHLMKKPTTVHSREDLIAAGWLPKVDVEPRTVDIHISNIRRALNRYGADIIRTVRSVGYSLDESMEA